MKSDDEQMKQASEDPEERAEAELKARQEAEEAADLGNGFRIRQDAIERVLPSDKEDHPRGRKFDVGGQPVYDPENEERLRQSAGKKSSAKKDDAPA